MSLKLKTIAKESLQFAQNMLLNPVTSRQNELPGHWAFMCPVDHTPSAAWTTPATDNFKMHIV